MGEVSKDVLLLHGGDQSHSHLHFFGRKMKSLGSPDQREVGSGLEMASKS